jgi:hypothetical protein
MKMTALLLTCSALCLPPLAFAGPSQSCASPKVDNITLSAYAPGCSGDSGSDAKTPGGLSPSKFKLDGKGGKVVLAAAPMRMPGCASKCYQYTGGHPDDGPATAQATNLSQKIFYFDDLCPGCKGGAKRPPRIDLAMSCSLARNFRVLHANLRPVPCTDEVYAEIKKNGNTEIASTKNSGRQSAHARRAPAQVANIRGDTSR